MKAFRPEGDAVVAEVEEFEVALLSSLAEQLRQLLGAAEGDAPDHSRLDAFERLAAVSGASVELDHGDPLIERLFPPAYADAKRDAEYRRYTEEEARLNRVSAANIVLADLAATREGTEPLMVPPDHVDAWLKTVNALRLSLSVRLGITDEASVVALGRLHARDPRAHLLDIYDWLGFVLESLLEAVVW